jgi:UDP-glucose 4-epimerase
MRILVTGGAGFIGSHVCRKLIEEGHEVSVIDDLSTGSLENLTGKEQFYRGNISFALDVEIAFLKFNPEVVIHLAAQAKVGHSIRYPISDLKVNTLGTVNILKSMKKYDVKKIIFASSAATYGDQIEFPVKEDAPKNITSPYAASKLSAENYIEMYGRLEGIEYCTFRFSNVFGPRQSAKDGGVLSIFLNKLLNNEELKVNGNGEQTRDFIYVKDLADAISFSIDNLQGTYNLSTGKEVTLNEVINIMKEFGNLSVSYGPKLSGDIERSVLDNRKLLSAGWQTKYTFEDGLKETLKSLKPGGTTI